MFPAYLEAASALLLPMAGQSTCWLPAGHFKEATKLHCSCLVLQVDVEAASGAAPTAQPSSTGARSVAAVEVLPAAAPPLSEQAPTSSPPAGADDDLGLVSN